MEEQDIKLLLVDTTEENRFCWYRVNINISEYNTESVKQLFECNGVSYADVSIDDIKIFEEPVLNVNKNALVKKIDIQNYPNLFSINKDSSTGTTISFSLKSNKTVNLAVYNLK